MRDILGHKARNQDEIVAILMRSGTYTCPTLPHYRYSQVKNICASLEKLGLIEQSGRNPESRNLRVTNLFREWALERDEQITDLGAVKWARARRELAA